MEVADWLGLMHFMDAMMLMTVSNYVEPTSDENVTVMDTEFSNVSVRLYLPRRAPEGLRRAVVFFHGGGWCLGQAGEVSPPRVGAASCSWELRWGGSGNWCFTGSNWGRLLGCHLEASSKRNVLLHTSLFSNAPERVLSDSSRFRHETL